ncbi:MAG: HAD family phosphatase [Lawsonibacter sp.]|nr:HAD family phosphatase [Lawsonibacter sp.]
MIELISLDLDGTLLDPKGQVTAPSRAAIARARAAGIRVIVNTGRDCREAEWFAREAGCDTLTSSTGGALVQDRGRTLRRWDVPEPSGRRALELVLGWEEVGLLIFAGEKTLVGSRYKRELERYYPFPVFHENAVVTDDPLGYMEEHRLPLTKLHGELDPSRYPIRALAGLEGVFLTASSSHDFELVAAGADKGRALALIAGAYGVPLERCAAVGDSANDLEALRTAGMPIAMGNAPQSVKDAALRIAPPNSQEGAAWAVLSCLE